MLLDLSKGINPSLLFSKLAHPECLEPERTRAWLHTDLDYSILCYFILNPSHYPSPSQGDQPASKNNSGKEPKLFPSLTLFSVISSSLCLALHSALSHLPREAPGTAAQRSPRGLPVFAGKRLLPPGSQRGRLKGKEAGAGREEPRLPPAVRSLN